MSAVAGPAWGWRTVDAPMPARAAVAWGSTLPHFLARLTPLLKDECAARMTVCARSDMVVLFGEEDKLPWVEGVRYAAPSAIAPQLWLPTVEHPDVPHDLLARALYKQHTRQPLLLWHTPLCVVPLDRQVPLSEAWLHRMNEVCCGRA